MEAAKAFVLALAEKLTEIEVLNKLIEVKPIRIGENSANIAASNNDLEDTEKCRADNLKMLDDLEAFYQTKTAA